jgi:hypothetical protein
MVEFCDAGLWECLSGECLPSMIKALGKNSFCGVSLCEFSLSTLSSCLAALFH